MKNLVILIGHVGGDPDVKKIGDKNVAKFSLATFRKYTKGGEKVTETQWHNIVAWTPHAEIVQNYVHKGSRLYIEGEIRYRSYEDRNGISHDITEIFVNQLLLMDSKPSEKTSEKTSEKKEFPPHVEDFINLNENI